MTRPTLRSTNDGVPSTLTDPMGHAGNAERGSVRPHGELGTGDVVAGKYVIERVLGRGGMGQVLAARHVELGTLVAIKTVLPTLLEAGGGVARFKREALAMAHLQSEHAVRVHDVGETDDGTPYILMEYLEGNDLWSELQRRGPLPPAEATAWILEACDALAEAHEQGIVHRDVKPGNLFLAQRKSGRRTIRVLDFGIAKALPTGPLHAAGTARANFAETQAGAMLGTPNFMAPEQAKGTRDPIGPQTDVYGVGATLYTLLTGRYPFESKSPVEVLRQVIDSAPVPPTQLRPEIPAALETVVLRCLQKVPAARFQDIGELAHALERAMHITRARGDVLLPLPPSMEDLETEVTGPPPGATDEASEHVLPAPAVQAVPPPSPHWGTTTVRLPAAVPRLAPAREAPAGPMHAAVLATPSPATAAAARVTSNRAAPASAADGRRRLTFAAVSFTLVWVGAASVVAVVFATAPRAATAKATGTAAAARSLAAAAAKTVARATPPARAPAPQPEGDGAAP